MEFSPLCPLILKGAWSFVLKTLIPHLAQIHRVVSPAKGGISKQWKLLSKPVGPQCLATLLGIGNDRLQNASRGRLDLRFRLFGKVAKRNCLQLGLPPSLMILMHFGPANLGTEANHCEDEIGRHASPQALAICGGDVPEQVVNSSICLLSCSTHILGYSRL